jgi:hypothetical protein
MRMLLAVLLVAFGAVAHARTMRVRLTPFVVEPQSERIPCEYVMLPNARPKHHLQPIDVVGRNFEIPPGQTTVYIGDFVAPFDLNVAMVSSHQHQTATREVITPILGGVVQEPIYENRRWNEPHLRWLDPPIHLHPGDRLRLRCEWFNTTDHTLYFGNSANDEMCNLNAYFFHDVEIPAEQRRTLGGFLATVPE